MFGLFTNVVKTTLDVGGGLLEGRTPSKRQIAELVDAGLTVAAISATLGVAEDVIIAAMEENN